MMPKLEKEAPVPLRPGDRERDAADSSKIILLRLSPHLAREAGPHVETGSRDRASILLKR
jgi:hypothetical protein